MKESKISMFTLERYRLGELSPADIEAVKGVLAADKGLGDRLKTLDDSDRELRLRYPAEFFGLESRPKRTRFSIAVAGKRIAPLAAVFLLCILLPLVYGVRNTEARNPNPSQDRAKGAVMTGAELSLYLKGDREIPLSDHALLSEGDTIQLAYTASDGERYGVIFSIDGRSLVTMHYPYWKGQSSLLVSGKRTFLDEAYTLDDAPGYEVFVMVVSGEPLDAEAVLHEAGKIAANSELSDLNSHDIKSAGLKSADLQFIEDKSRAAFEGCEVETVTVLKSHFAK